MRVRTTGLFQVLASSATLRYLKIIIWPTMDFRCRQLSKGYKNCAPLKQASLDWGKIKKQRWQTVSVIHIPSHTSRFWRLIEASCKVWSCRKVRYSKASNSRLWISTSSSYPDSTLLRIIPRKGVSWIQSRRCSLQTSVFHWQRYLRQTRHHLTRERVLPRK